MATADQIKGLIKAYIDKDNARFKTIVLQIAAYEAKLNHTSLARDLKLLSDKIKNSKVSVVDFRGTKNRTDSLFEVQHKKFVLRDLIVSNDIEDKIKRILVEFKNRRKLYSYGMENRRKILIEGAPGTGKTLTATVIANELNLPLYVVQMDKLISKFMGETSAKLRQIFDDIEENIGVYFFDEFDAIGADRSLDNEVGEMRRILNSYLQFLEQDMSESLIIAATNNSKLLDQALLRRFDDVLHYKIPTAYEIKRLYEYKLSIFASYLTISDLVIESSLGLNHAEIIRVCDDAIKQSILTNKSINEADLLSLIKERLYLYTQEA
ncbi:AAA family ATPase [Veillonella seminalis]|uniref:AAA+ ATPase domain-containing protein n=1 Tax=Veillonella seminalis ACS-216-V-Col6b TaxID=883156 RepID=K9D526_9FIRM|nr:ATP-binding protein [Veillonella seminalis]EKU79328.1 hypothetical protein HMPREF9282_00136 [Veillonella seminalis ACS-216-V-Col6b]